MLRLRWGFSDHGETKWKLPKFMAQDSGMSPPMMENQMDKPSVHEIDWAWGYSEVYSDSQERVNYRFGFRLARVYIWCQFWETLNQHPNLSKQP